MTSQNESDSRSTRMRLVSSAAAVVLSLAPGLAAEPVRLVLPERHGPLMDKAVAIFTRRVNERCGVPEVPARATTVTIELRVRIGGGAGGFTISSGSRGSVR